MNNKLLRKDKTYGLHELPELKSNSFKWGNKVGYTGSLIKRPIKETLGVYKHMGLIYGFDTNGTLWIIENNINGVECITLSDFLKGSRKYDVIHNTNQKSCLDIIKRARERPQLEYNARTNNCEQFVNYCLMGSSDSPQVEATEAVADILISLIEIRVCLSPKPNDHKILDDLNQMRNTFRINRNEEMQEIFDKMRADLQIPQGNSDVKKVSVRTSSKITAEEKQIKMPRKKAVKSNKNL